MTKYTHILPVLLVAVLGLSLAANAPGLWAHDSDGDTDGNGALVELEEAAVFFEFNTTDLDLGIQLFWDGEGWTEMEVTGPDGEIFEVENDGSLSAIGSTELFMESSEPELVEDPDTATDDEIEAAVDAFLATFPEGEYEFSGKTVDGDPLIGTAELTHDLAVPVELDLSSFPDISWTDVSEAGDPEIVRYEIIVEIEAEIDGEEVVFLNTAIFPASVTTFTVAEEFVDLAEDLEDSGELLEFKVEILADEESGNRTIVEEEVE